MNSIDKFMGNRQLQERLAIDAVEQQDALVGIDAAIAETELQTEREQLELRAAQIQALAGELQRQRAQVAALEASFQAERRRVLFYADRLSEVSRERDEARQRIEWLERPTGVQMEEVVPSGLSREELRVRLLQAARHEIPLLRIKRFFTYPSRKARRRHREKLAWWKLVLKTMEAKKR